MYLRKVVDRIISWFCATSTRWWKWFLRNDYDQMSKLMSRILGRNAYGRRHDIWLMLWRHSGCVSVSVSVDVFVKLLWQKKTVILISDEHSLLNKKYSTIIFRKTVDYYWTFILEISSKKLLIKKETFGDFCVELWIWWGDDGSGNLQSDEIDPYNL